MDLAKLLVLAAFSLSMAGSLVAQGSGNWTCNDDQSTTIATNTGSGNETYKITVNHAWQTDDTTLNIVVFSIGANGQEVIEQTIEWTSTSDVSVTLGAGKSLRIEDPSDQDTNKGSGTWQKI